MRLVKLAMLLGAMLLIASCAQDKPLPTEIEFQTDFETAKAMAIESDMPMIIDFYTDWCKWCKVLDTVTYVDPIVIGLSADNIFVKINAEVDTLLAQEYGISGYPTILITKPTGEEIDRIWGYMEPADFYNQVQLYLQGKETLEDYLKRHEDEPENLEYLSMLGEKYASRSNYDEASKYYNNILELDSDNSQGYGAKAMESIYDAQARKKDFNAVIKTCADLIAKYPGTKQAENASARIGYYLEKSGDKVEALKAYNGFLASFPESDAVEWVTNRVTALEGSK
jgi:thiol-disulfide isomerase/thioredoxin